MTEIKKTVEVDKNLMSRFEDEKPVVPQNQPIIPQKQTIVPQKQPEEEDFDIEEEEGEGEYDEEEEYAPESAKKVPDNEDMRLFKEFMEQKKKMSAIKPQETPVEKPAEESNGLPGLVLLTGAIGFAVMLAKGFMNGGGKSK